MVANSNFGLVEEIYIQVLCRILKAYNVELINVLNVKGLVAGGHIFDDTVCHVDKRDNLVDCF